jgi:hypothetical protein
LAIPEEVLDEPEPTLRVPQLFYCRNRGDDSCDEAATDDTHQSSESTEESSIAGGPASTGDTSNQRGPVTVDDAMHPFGNVWPTVGSLARVPETEEYVFVLNVSHAHDKLQGVRTSRLSEETRAQIAAAGEPSQLDRVADAVRLVTDGPHCSGHSQAYEPVPLETVANPDLLMTDS